MTAPAFDTAQWTLCVVAALCIGLSKAGFGGISMLAILIMAQILPARESTGAILPMLIIADIFAVKAYHQYSNARLVLRLLPAAVTGIVCGWILIPFIPVKHFGHLIGWLTLALLGIAVIQRLRPNFLASTVASLHVAFPFGWLAGLTTMLANAAGPVMTIYLLACRLPKMEFVGTAAWFFFVVNVIKIPFSVSLGFITTSSLLLDAILAPAIIGGVFLGRWLLGKINQATFEWLMIVFSLAGALRLILLG